MPFPISKTRMFVMGLSLVFVTIVYSTMAYVLLTKAFH